MMHDEAMDFLWLGVMLERLGQTARTLDMHHHIRGAAEAQQQPLLQIGALAVAAARLLRVRGLHAQAAGARQRRERARRSCCSRAASRARCATACARRWAWSSGSPRPGTGGIADARKRLDALDHWLDNQEKAGVPSSEHALLTRIVDETGAACGELQGGLEGEEPAPAAASQSQAQ